MKSVNWKEVFIFFIVATAVSAPFRLSWLDMKEILPLPGGFNIFYNVLRGIGPLVGFVILFYGLKSKTLMTNSFFGINKLASIFAIVVIPIGLAVVGVPNSMNLNENYFGFLYGAMLVLYAIGEEYGWRGYLQEALRDLPLFIRVLAIASIWYLWHLSFLLPDVSLKTHVIHFGALVLGSWGLLKITDMSKSILFASAVHLSFNLFGDVRGDLQGRLIVLSVAVISWVIVLQFIKRKNSTAELR